MQNLTQHHGLFISEFSTGYRLTMKALLSALVGKVKRVFFRKAAHYHCQGQNDAYFQMGLSPNPITKKGEYLGVSSNS